jgi:hypothetical protein
VPEIFRWVPPSDRRRTNFRPSPLHLPTVAGPPSEIGWAARRAILTSQRDVGRGPAPGRGLRLLANATRARFLMPNRSPMRWPKLVGGFHLPSAVCPPSVFGETPSGRVWQDLEALDGGPGAQSFMTHNPHRGGRNWSVASAFRPTFVRLRRSPGADVAKTSTPSTCPWAGWELTI